MLASLLFPVLLIAQSESRAHLQSDTRPVEMSSDGGMSIDLKRKIGRAKGDVLIKRDDVLVCCDEAEAHYLANQIESVTCKGRVVIVRPDGTRATANLAVFIAAEDKITLTGKARVVAEAGDLAGEKIVYDIGTDQLEVEGGKSRFNYRPAADKGLGTKNVPERACPPVSGAAGR